MTHFPLLSLAAAAALTLSSTLAQAAPTVFIPLGTGNQVIAVDAATNRITARFSNVVNAHGLVITPDAEYLVAGSLQETALPAGSPVNAPNSKLYVVHPVHGHVMNTIAVSGWTHHQAITPDGRYVISTHPTRGGVSVADLQTNQVARTIETGPAPNYTVVTCDGKQAFVTNSGNGTISQIDLASWKVLRQLEGGPAPEHLVMSGDEKTLYSLNPRAGTVSVVAVDTGKVVQTHKVGTKLHGLDIGDDGNTLFVTDRSANKLVALNLRDGAQRSIELAPAPYHLNTIRGTGKVYVTSSSDPIVWVVDLKTLAVTGTIALPAGVGHQMAVMP